MEAKNFMTAEDISKEMSLSRSSAYKIIRMLNVELDKKGFLTTGGRVPTKYFTERFYLK